MGRRIISPQRCCSIRPTGIALRSTFGRSGSSCQSGASFSSTLPFIRLTHDDPTPARYTLIIGRPPFQTKEIKAIYKSVYRGRVGQIAQTWTDHLARCSHEPIRRIKENSYDFPPEKPISKEAQDLVTQILTIDPRTAAITCYIIERLY